MLPFFALLVAIGFITGVVGLIVAIVQAVRVGKVEEELSSLRQEVADLRRRASAVPPAPRPEAGTAVPGPIADHPAPAAASPPTVPAAVPVRPAAIMPPPPSYPPAAPDPVVVERPAPSMPPAAATVAPVDQDGDHALGNRWLAWTGAALLVIGLALLAKFAWDRGWIGNLLPPPARIALVAGVAIACVAVGWRRALRVATPLSQALAGTGLAGLYLAMVAARTPALGLVPEPLLGAGGAFACLGAVSLLALVVAVQVRAPVVALLALFGAQLALLVAPDSGSRHGLLVHQVLVAAAVVGAAAWRGWRWVATAGAVSVVAGSGLWWLHRGPEPGGDPIALALLAAMAGIIALLPGWRSWRARQDQSPWALTLAVAAVAWFTVQAVALLREPAPWGLAAVAAVLALAGTVLWRAAAARTPGDGPTQAIGLVLTALGGALAVLAVVPADAQGAAWLVQGAALLALPRWLGVAMPLALRVSGLVAAGLGLLRTLVLVADWDRQGWCDPVTLALLVAAAAVAAIAGRCALAPRDSFDTGTGATALVLWPILFGLAGIAVADGAGWPQPGAAGFTAVVCCLAVLGAVALARPVADPVGRIALLPPLAGILVAGLVAMGDRQGWWILANPWCAAAAVAGLAVVRSGRRSGAGEALRWWPVGLGAWILATAELASWVQAAVEPPHAATAALLAVTLLWGLSSFALLLTGIHRGQRPVRIVALTGFAVTAIKLLLVDLAGRDAGARIAAFLAVGVLFLAGSWAYQRYARRRTPVTGPASPPPSELQR